MARKKKKKATHHKRRRVGGLMTGLGEVLKLIGGVTGGVLAGRFVNTLVPATVSGAIVGGAQFAGGVILVKKAKSTLVKGVGAGVAANGLGTALGAKGLKVLPASMGYGPPGPMPYRGMAGYRDVPKIGFPKPGAIGRGGNMESSRMARHYAGVYN